MKRCVICGNPGDEDSTVCSVCGNSLIDIPDPDEENEDDAIELPLPDELLFFGMDQKEPDQSTPADGEEQRLKEDMEAAAQPFTEEEQDPAPAEKEAFAALTESAEGTQGKGQEADFGKENSASGEGMYTEAELEQERKRQREENSRSSVFESGTGEVEKRRQNVQGGANQETNGQMGVRKSGTDEPTNRTSYAQGGSDQAAGRTPYGQSGSGQPMNRRTYSQDGSGQSDRQPYGQGGPGQPGSQAYSQGGSSQSGSQAYSQGGPGQSDRQAYGQSGPVQSGRQPYSQGGSVPTGRQAYGQGGSGQSGRQAYGQGGSVPTGRQAYGQGGSGQSGRQAYGQGGSVPTGRQAYGQGGSVPTGRQAYGQGRPVQSGRQAYGQGGSGQPMGRQPYAQGGARQAGNRVPYTQGSANQMRSRQGQGNVPNHMRAGQPQGTMVQQRRGSIPPGTVVVRQGVYGQRLMSQAKGMFRSPLFVLLALLNTVALGVSVAGILLKDLNYSGLLSVLENFDMPVEALVYVDRLMELLSRVEGITVLGLAGKVPDLLLCLGFWMLLVTALRKSEGMASAGFLTVKIAVILKMIVSCVVLGACLIFSVTLVVSAWVSGGRTALIASAVFLGIMIIVSMAAIMYFFCLLHALKACRKNAVMGEEFGTIPLYAAVLTIVIALVSAVGLLSAVVNAEIAGMVSYGCQIGWMLLLGIWMMSYRNKTGYNE